MWRTSQGRTDLWSGEGRNFRAWSRRDHPPVTDANENHARTTLPAARPKARPIQPAPRPAWRPAAPSPSAIALMALIWIGIFLGLSVGYVSFNDPTGVGRAIAQFARLATNMIAPLLNLRTTLLSPSLDATIAIYVGIGLAACVLAFVVWFLLRRRCGANENLLDTIIERQSPGSGRQRPFWRGPEAPPLPGRRGRKANWMAADGTQLSMLEGHLRSAVLDTNARERLVKDAMASGGRAAAIRKVLRDLEDEDKRWSS
jgi:hypothetical protein